MEERQSQVQEFFEQPEVYRYYDYNLRIRHETLSHYLQDLKVTSILDAPCGTGEITLPFCKVVDQITQVDFAEAMVNVASENAEQMSNVKVRRADIFDLEPAQFDLVVSLGILSHVEDYEAFIKHINRFVKRGGYLCIQNTDCEHYYYRWIRWYRGLRGVFKKQYKLTEVPHQGVVDVLRSLGYVPKMDYRYNQSFLGFSHFFSNKKKYRLTRKWFGSAAIPKNQAKGSDHIMLWQKS